MRETAGASRTMPVGVPVESRSILPPAGVGRGGGDAGGEEGGGVGDDDVAVGAVEDGGVAGGDFVEVLAGGEGVADFHLVWSQPAPTIHWPGLAVAA